MIGPADGAEPFLNYSAKYYRPSLMNSVPVAHSKQVVRDDAAMEGIPRKAGCITLIKGL